MSNSSCADFKIFTYCWMWEWMGTTGKNTIPHQEHANHIVHSGQLGQSRRREPQLDVMWLKEVDVSSLHCWEAYHVLDAQTAPGTMVNLYPQTKAECLWLIICCLIALWSFRFRSGWIFNMWQYDFQSIFVNDQMNRRLSLPEQWHQQ